MKAPKTTRRGGGGFTLVELLVVISIIVILMSILLPALKTVRLGVGVGICAKQIKSLNEAFHAYINEYMEDLPFSAGTANLETYEIIDAYKSRPSGFGVLYEAKLVEDPKMFYCPSAEVVYGDPETRLDYMDNFQGKFDRRDEIMCDYAMGYRTDEEANTGYSPYPFYLTGANKKIENLKRTHIAWMADCMEVGWPRPYHSIKHKNFTFCNVGMLDASVEAIHDYQDHRPTAGQIKRAKFPVDTGNNRDDYWPANDRPGWLWWRWFGPGNGY